ncbi:MAG: toll/interleukin-1 receptor domain-containing protein [Gammaproteobacteria bacterium]|nr:toll/interleukin-1 receptor domain-containing protein [Gammaproteobacteria bacterium]
MDFSTSQVNVAVFLAGDELAASSDWQRYVSDITEKTRGDPLACRVFPVAMTPSGQRVVPNVQAMRWHSWTGGEEERTSHLLFELTHELGRMLDAYHRHLRDPSQGASALMSIDPVRVFLSHSKHDTVGEAYATEMRNWLHERSRLNSFIDLVGIPAGQSFEEVLSFEVARSAVIVFHSDSFSRREWCRREVLLAKRLRVSVVVASCLAEGDERGFPYLGNVPTVPLTGKASSTQALVSRLLDEVLLQTLWRCRTAPLSDLHGDILFVPHPPELLTFAQLGGPGTTPSLIVYPDPPLGSEEERLFEGLQPPVRSFSEWLVDSA